MENINKKKYGQFYTTNYDYILQNLKIPDNINNIIEPFAGNGDLLNFIKNTGKKFECYDIEPKKSNIIKRDTLLKPPDYNDKFVITNPPYLARNKSNDKTIFDKYNQNDLYKCFLINLINSKLLGGIIIIPLNFWCSIRKSDIELREKFLNKFNIIKLNIFEEKVFEDTSYTICSFQFENKAAYKNYTSTECIIYPNNKKIEFNLNKNNNFTFGGYIYKLIQNKNIKIERLTKKNKNSSCITKILAKCIDDNINNKIRLELVDTPYIDETLKLSARSYASLIIKPEITLEQQKKLCNDFNNYLNKEREKYNSLFLTNYRESNSIARKRISFTLVFQIVNYLLNDKNL
mgnify:CR=1 FL=1